MKECGSIWSFLEAYSLVFVIAMLIAVAIFVILLLLMFRRSHFGRINNVGKPKMAQNDDVIKQGRCAMYKCKIGGCIGAMGILLGAPFIVHWSFPQYFAGVMCESQNFVVTKQMGYEVISKASDYGTDRNVIDKPNSHDLIVMKLERSRAPAVFILVFLCFFYVMIWVVVISSLICSVKARKRETLLNNIKERIGLLINEIRKEENEIIVSYKKKILDRYILIYFENCDEQW